MKQTTLILLAAAAGAVVLVERYGRQQLSRELQGGFTSAELASLDSQTSFVDALKAGFRKLTGQIANPVEYSVRA